MADLKADIFMVFESSRFTITEL